MRILVLGSGLMGPAAAFNAMTDPQVSQICLCDMSEAQLELARRKLAGKQGADKLATAVLNLEIRPRPAGSSPASMLSWPRCRSRRSRWEFALRRRPRCRSLI